jgi:hypothetical protein
MVPPPPPETPPSAPTYQRGEGRGRGGGVGDGGGGGMLDVWARPWRAHAFLTISVKFAGIFLLFPPFSLSFFFVRACASHDRAKFAGCTF